jgi:hypothetical protein
LLLLLYSTATFKKNRFQTYFYSISRKHRNDQLEKSSDETAERQQFRDKRGNAVKVQMESLMTDLSKKINQSQEG